MARARGMARYWFALCAALLGTLVAPVPPVVAAPADADDVLREEWAGDIFRSSYRFGVCVDRRGKARGVVLLRTPSGQVDVYHVYGERQAGGTIVTRHPSGHRFELRVVDGEHAHCRIQLKNSLHLSTTATRVPNARLSKDTCRPQ